MEHKEDNSPTTRNNHKRRAAVGTQWVRQELWREWTGIISGQDLLPKLRERKGRCQYKVLGEVWDKI